MKNRLDEIFEKIRGDKLKKYKYTSSFEGILAKYYDDFFWEENRIVEETMYLNKLIRNYCDSSCMADVGCGTGIMDYELSKYGYDIIGLDISPDMIREAEKRVQYSEEQHKLKFIVGNICDNPICCYAHKVDVIISMSHVVGYQHTNQSLHDFFRNINKSLVIGGLFIFNFYHAPALYNNLIPKEKTIRTKNTTIDRYSFCKMNQLENVLMLNYKYIITEPEDISVINIQEKMRYFTLLELEYYLTCNGFDIVNTYTYLTDKALTEQDWNGCIVVRKGEEL